MSSHPFVLPAASFGGDSERPCMRDSARRDELPPPNIPRASETAHADERPAALAPVADGRALGAEKASVNEGDTAARNATATAIAVPPVFRALYIFAR